MPACYRFLAALLASALLILSGCSFDASPQDRSHEQAAPSAEEHPSDDTAGDAVPETQPAPEPVPPPEPVLPPPTEATLIAVGDIMMHTPQLPGSYNEKTKSYDFTHFFRRVAPIISEGDWAIANLETPLAGAERGYRGYPQFNAPDELADALKSAGFNILTTANNHALDQGASGTLRTLKTVRQRGLSPIGTFEDAESAEKPLIVEKNGIVNAILSYSYGTNGIPVPKDKPYLISLIDQDRIKQQIIQARQDGADLVTVALHFGVEYQRKPNDAQRELAQQCIQAGADIVLGSHPHVVQPYERIDTVGDDGSKRSGIVIYSLGNFISNQFGDYKEYGVIFKVRVKKTYVEPDQAITEVIAIDPIPTWVHKYRKDGKSMYRVLPVEEVAAAKDDPLIPQRMFPVLKQRAAEMVAHLHSLQPKETADASP
jgi:poly-gamma-glutamate capsule biosynthesis protein CapA/YwtB (metallophosphatase superfamily)